MCKRSKRSNVCESWFLGTEHFLAIVLEFCIFALKFRFGSFCWQRSARTVLYLTPEFHLGRVRVSISVDVMLFFSEGPVC